MTVPALDSRLAQIENQHKVRLGVLGHTPATGRVYAHRGDERFAMCSTFKMYAAAGILRLESLGKLSLDETVPVEPADIVVNSPVTTEHQGRVMTVGGLCEAALTRSDNTAANLLLRRLGGPDTVTALARSVGDGATRLDRWEPELNEAGRGDERDTTTAVGLGTGCRELLVGAGLPPPQQRMLTGWMRASLTSGKRIRAALPRDWTAADKTGGGLHGTVNDAGVVWSPSGNPLVLVVLSDSTTGNPDVPIDDAPTVAATTAVIEAMAAHL
ncbi:beta-lactamase class A [Rhodococcus coprophilus]|uniref:Beta-lactamase n=1 Tax=Rhodococcus coprophilus TaxID=38310 RepID=A0A2X4X341_9NOCA|nr:beta-lactamase class A [Rhodococcus coprophilus]SQI30894.1 beta-lactamase, penicillin binding protein [Rhodococcus coprophilus]